MNRGEITKELQGFLYLALKYFRWGWGAGGTDTAVKGSAW